MEATPATILDDVDLENDLIQLLVSEAVRAGLETPLRDPILEAVAETTDEPVDANGDERTDDGVTDDEGTSRVAMAIQGLVVFVVTFAALYVAFRHLLGDEET